MIELRRYAKWNGTAQEWRELQVVVARHCACAAQQVCATHDMVIRDQRAVNGLVFARRIVEQLLVEEFRPPAPARSSSARRAPHAPRGRYSAKSLAKIPVPEGDNPLPAGGGSTPS